MEPNNPSDINQPVETPVVVPANTPVVHAAPIGSAPIGATPIDAGEGIAERYVADELLKARASLKRTQLIGSLLVLLTLAYMGWMATRFRQELEPERAAETAGGLIGERVTDQAQGLADQVKERLPQLIAGLPDYALTQMPQYREQLENQIQSDLAEHSKVAAENLSQHLDAFLDEHKDEIKTVLDSGKDSQASKALGAELEAEFMKSLKTTQAGGGESLQTKLDKSLQMLKEVNVKIARLATAKNLTPQERKARRAIAIMTAQINREVKSNGLENMPQNLKLTSAGDSLGDTIGNVASGISSSLSDSGNNAGRSASDNTGTASNGATRKGMAGVPMPSGAPGASNAMPGTARATMPGMPSSTGSAAPGVALGVAPRNPPGVMPDAAPGALGNRAPGAGKPMGGTP